jgi:hypothetical protein
MPDIIKISDLPELNDTPSSGSYFIVLDETETIESQKVKKVTAANATANLTAIVNLLHPVGSIYIATIATNPATLFGVGTWTAYGAGRVLVGLDAGQTEFDTVNETGGAKTHTLTSDEMPSHTHTQNAHTHTISAVGPLFRLQHLPSGGDGIWARTDATPLAASSSVTATNQNTGGGAAHNNLQPYVVVYMWRRVS